MNVIKGLIKKDLLNLASYKQSVFIIIAFLSIFCAFSEDMSQFMPIAVSAAIGMIALSTFNYDEISKANSYLSALPTNKKEIVKEKYIFIIISTILGGIIGAVLTILINNIIKAINPEFQIMIDYNSLLTTTISGMFGVSLIEAIQIPSIYKWGAERGRIQMFILIFLIILIILGGVFLFSHLKLGIDINNISNFIEQYGIAILITLTILMLYISYKISCKIYNKSEY